MIKSGINAVTGHHVRIYIEEIRRSAAVASSISEVGGGEGEGKCFLKKILQLTYAVIEQSSRRRTTHWIVDGSDRRRASDVIVTLNDTLNKER